MSGRWSEEPCTADGSELPASLGRAAKQENFEDALWATPKEAPRSGLNCHFAEYEPVAPIKFENSGPMSFEDTRWLNELRDRLFESHCAMQRRELDAGTAEAARAWMERDRAERARVRAARAERRAKRR